VPFPFISQAVAICLLPGISFSSPSPLCLLSYTMGMCHYGMAAEKRPASRCYPGAATIILDVSSGGRRLFRMEGFLRCLHFSGISPLLYLPCAAGRRHGIFLGRRAVYGCLTGPPHTCACLSSALCLVLYATKWQHGAEGVGGFFCTGGETRSWDRKYLRLQHPYLLYYFCLPSACMQVPHYLPEQGYSFGQGCLLSRDGGCLISFPAAFYLLAVEVTFNKRISLCRTARKPLAAALFCCSFTTSSPCLFLRDTVGL